MTQEPDAAREPHASRESYRKDLSHRFHRALRLTGASAVLPGAGLTRTRLSRIGWALVALAIAGLGALGYAVLTNGLKQTALGLASRPTLLRWVAIGIIVGGLLWVGSIVATAWASRPADLDRSRSRALTTVAAALSLLVGFVSWQASNLLLTAGSTVSSVFKADPSSGSSVKIATEGDPWEYTPRVNILLLGSDTRNEGDGVRTDTMIVASIDTESGRTALISIPRNLQRVPLPADSPLRTVYPSGFYGVPYCTGEDGECMLNGIWTSATNYKTEHPDSYKNVPAPGRTETRAAIEEVTGLKMDHTVIVDFVAFERLVNTMGGLTVNVKLSGYGTQLPVGGHLGSYGTIVGEEGWFVPGSYKLDGRLSLWYARARAADDDFFRQQRQRCVVRDIVNQVNPATMLTQYSEVADILKNNIYTDIPAEDLPAYVELVNRVQRGAVQGVGLTPAEGINPGRPDYTKVRAIIKKAIAPPVAPTPAKSTASQAATGTPTTEPTTTTATPTPTAPTDATSTAASTTASAPKDECALDANDEKWIATYRAQQSATGPSATTSLPPIALP